MTCEDPAKAVSTPAQQLRLLVDTSPNPAMIIRPPHGDVLHLNDEARRALGYENVPLSDIPGTPVLFPDHETRKKLREQTLTRGWCDTVDLPIKTKAGHSWRVRLSAMRFVTEDGTVILLQINDIDFACRTQQRLEAAYGRLEAQTGELRAMAADLRLMTEEVDQAKTRARQAEKAKADFLAMISHEIRTPLNGVMGMAALMEADGMAPSQQQKLDVIRHSGQTLLSIISDILDFSKLQSGALQLNPEDIAVCDLAERVVEMVRGLATEKGLALSLEIAGDVPDTIRIDATRARQILLNLVGNAVKFTMSGWVKVTVSSRPALEGDAMLSFEVADSGPGISPSARETMFQEFSQGESGMTRSHGGTGMGLALSRRLSRLMGGDIRVESSPGKAGAVFTLTLPCQVIGATSERAAEPESGLTGMRILVAEDNFLNQRVVSSILRAWGAEFEVVPDGAAAIEAVQGADFEAILMDIQMPKMDGISATKAIRALPGALNRIPIIALTANAMQGDREKYLAAGMDDYVAKPIDANILYRALLNQRMLAAAADRRHA